MCNIIADHEEQTGRFLWLKFRSGDITVLSESNSTQARPAEVNVPSSAKVLPVCHIPLMCLHVMEF
jgi:hypothetical protein